MMQKCAKFACADTLINLHKGEQGWCSGESTRLPSMLHGFKSLCGLSLLLVLSYCSKGFFSGCVSSKFQFNLECTDAFKQVFKGAVSR